jgi:hypothetical protein
MSPAGTEHVEDYAGAMEGSWTSSEAAILLKSWNSDRTDFQMRYWEEDFFEYIDRLWWRHEAGDIRWVEQPAGPHAQDPESGLRLLRMHSKHNQIFTDHFIPDNQKLTFQHVLARGMNSMLSCMRVKNSLILSSALTVNRALPALDQVLHERTYRSS